jgi:hypothetical protein
VARIRASCRSLTAFCREAVAGLASLGTRGGLVQAHCERRAGGHHPGLVGFAGSGTAAGAGVAADSAGWFPGFALSGPGFLATANKYKNSDRTKSQKEVAHHSFLYGMNSRQSALVQIEPVQGRYPSRVWTETSASNHGSIPDNHDPAWCYRAPNLAVTAARPRRCSLYSCPQTEAGTRRSRNVDRLAR